MGRVSVAKVIILILAATVIHNAGVLGDVYLAYEMLTSYLYKSPSEELTLAWKFLASLRLGSFLVERGAPAT